MPPWGADPAHGVFKNDPRLSDKEVETIVAWVDAGAPKGKDQDLPAAPTFVEGWSIGKPDAVFTMTEDSGGATVRSTNGLSARAPQMALPRIRGRSESM